MKFISFNLIILLLLFSVNGVAEETKDNDNFQFEQSDFSPNTNTKWNVSGYVKALGDFPTDKRKSEIELDDLSLFISGNINQWVNPFIEAEYFSGVLWQSQAQGKFSDGKFIVERLYNDFKISPNSQIRLGKFLAPVGFWNLTHAAPLVWTINRPVSSTFSYSNYITGLEYGHTLNANSGARFDVYLQLTEEFNPKPLSHHPRRYDKIMGGSWTLADNLDARSSLDMQYAQIKDSAIKRLTLSFQRIWYLQEWDVDTQIIYTKITNTSQKKSNNLFYDDSLLTKNGWDGGGYVQARYRFAPHWNMYGRGEYYHFAEQTKAGGNIIFGGQYRLGKWGNINAEYKWGDGAQLIKNKGFSLSYNAMFRW